VADVRGNLSAIATVAAATGAGWLLYHGLQWPSDARPPLVANTNVLMLYLLSVLWIATRHSRGAAILASILGVAAFDFCFVPPYLTFNVADTQYIITFGVMLVAALVISTLTYRVRSQSQAAREAWERAETEFLRNTLLSGVSNDLRTPLAAITGAVSVIIESGDRIPDSAKADLLTTISDESERMERLIGNLLDMTRLESGGAIVEKDWQSIPEVVGSALHHLDKRLRGREVTTRILPDLPMVQLDAVAIEQVLVNLIDNALEHTAAGTEIEISATDGGGKIVIEVADRGPGLPPRAEKRVFEKFFRASSTDGRSRRGIGLGLAICKGIVELHGGTISAGNRNGGGAVFRFTLPRVGQAPLVDATR
jgi:two-component system, OmpR family, sensor histidine kinase KdpD